MGSWRALFPPVRVCIINWICSGVKLATSAAILAGTGGGLEMLDVAGCWRATDAPRF